MEVLGALVGWILGLVRLGARVEVRAHRAFIQYGEPPSTAASFPGPSNTNVECVFVTVNNPSPTRSATLTHVWFATEPPHYIHNSARPLRKTIPPDDVWETWAQVNQLPPSDMLYEDLARVRLANRRVFKSRLDENVPPEGTVPGP